MLTEWGIIKVARFRWWSPRAVKTRATMAWSTFEHKGFLRVRFYSQPFPCNAQDCTLIQNTFKIKILLFYPSLYNISKRITKSTTTRFVRKRYRNKEREINQIYVLDRREIPSETIPAWQPILQNHQLQMYSVQKLKYIIVPATCRLVVKACRGNPCGS